MNRQIIGSVVKRLMEPLAQRVRLAISRGVVKVVNDSLKCQGLQVSLLADELRDDVERWQEYGFTSVPHTDGNAEALFLSIGGNRAHGAVACVMDRTRRPLDLSEGDVCLYTEDGERVYIEKSSDVVHIGAKAAAAWIARADYTDARVDAIQQKFDAHIHPTTATIGPSAVVGAISAPTSLLGQLDTVAATKGKVT